MSTQDAIAAFLARGGKVTKVASDVRTMTDRELYLAARDPIVKRVVSDEIDEAISEREHEIGAMHGVDGLNDFREGVAKYGKRKMLGWEE